MSTKQKLLERISGPPYRKDITFDELCTALEQNGFTQIGNSGSSHFKFTHPDLPYHIELPKKKPMKAVYVKLVYSAIMAIM